MTDQGGFVGRQGELRILEERLAAAQMGHPQVVYVEGEAGAGKSTLLSRFLGSLSNAAVLEVGGDEAETLLSYGVVDQLQPGPSQSRGRTRWRSELGCWTCLDRLQADSEVVVLAIDDLQWVDRPSVARGAVRPAAAPSRQSADDRVFAGWSVGRPRLGAVRSR